MSKADFRWGIKAGVVIGILFGLLLLMPPGTP